MHINNDKEQDKNYTDYDVHMYSDAIIIGISTMESGMIRLQKSQPAWLMEEEGYSVVCRNSNPRQS